MINKFFCKKYNHLSTFTNQGVILKCNDKMPIFLKKINSNGVRSRFNIYSITHLSFIINSPFSLFQATNIA